MVLLLMTMASCGKKKQIISQNYTESNGVIVDRYEEFIDHDSAFEAYTDANGRLKKIKRAKNITELHDSTCTVEIFFLPSGKLRSFKKYISQKPEGKWTTFYESGKIESETDYKNGLMLGYETHFESGKLKAKGELLPDSTFRHREYFENGVQSKEMATDHNGNGSCTYWYPNKRMRSTGPITNFEPSGIWKGWDTAGVAGPDELIGIPQK